MSGESEEKANSSKDSGTWPEERRGLRSGWESLADVLARGCVGISCGGGGGHRSCSRDVGSERCSCLRSGALTKEDHTKVHR